MSIYQGDCRDIMRMVIADKSVQCCATSPPYFGLRDYGAPCQLGLEATPDEYVAQMVDVFRAVRDVLTDDGVLWLNLGSSYAGGGNGGGGSFAKERAGWSVLGARDHTGFKPKDMIPIPWMVAMALQADGWYLRQDIIWHKPNPMPESVTDRCTKAHEYLFLLTKSERYYCNMDAIKEPATGGAPGNKSHRGTTAAESDKKHRTKTGLVAYAERQRSKRDSFSTRNRRSVWTIPTRPYSGAHFATFPPALVEPCILAGSRPGDVVLDPFMGSGTVAAVAVEHGRRWVGAEINPAYIALAHERIRAAETRYLTS